MQVLGPVLVCTAMNPHNVGKFHVAPTDHFTGAAAKQQAELAEAMMKHDGLGVKASTWQTVTKCTDHCACLRVGTCTREQPMPLQ